MNAKKATYTIHFHDGSMEGDCSEANLLTDNPTITFKAALKELNTVNGMKRNWCVGNSPAEIEAELEDFKDCNEGLVGAWIVPADIEKKFNQASKSMSYAGNDSAAYAQQALWKGFYKAFAVRTIGKKVSKTS